MHTQLELDGLTGAINREHALAQKGLADALAHGWTCGAMLVQKRKEMAGHWLDWLAADFEGSQRTAYDYIKLSEDYDTIEDLQHAASIRAALGKGKRPGESTGDEWYTPGTYIRSVVETLGDIDLDPASCPQANATVGAKRFYGKDDDGLQQPWSGRVFMNPPFSKNSDFATKLFAEIHAGNVSEAIVLMAAYAIESGWFAPYWDHVMCFTGERVKFDTPTGEQVPGNIFGNVFVYIGPHEAEFARAFARHGHVMRQWPA